MGGLFKGPSVPKPPPIPEQPSVDTPAVQAAADTERKRARAGRAATMLSSDSTQDPMTARKKLLG